MDQNDPARILPHDEDDFVHDPPEGHSMTGVQAWQERAYFTLHGENGVGMDIGCGRHPDAGPEGSYSGYACLSTPDGKQTNVRAEGPLETRLGVPKADPFSFEIVEPHKRWNIGLAADPVLSVELRFEARSSTWALPQTSISSKGETVASTQVCFQSGVYHGTIETEGRKIEVNGWPGSRDRTWGFRRFEGRLPSGLMIAAIFEMADHAMIMWSIERRTGELVLANGARLYEDGSIVPIDAWSFDLDVDGDIGRLNGAKLTVDDKGSREEYEVTPAGSTIYLAGGGYLEKGRHGGTAEKTRAVTDTWDTTDPKVLENITGLDDHVVNLSGSAEGSGILELQLGKHERYRPDGWKQLHEGIEALGTRELIP